jgi:hypothetical protein
MGVDKLHRNIIIMFGAGSNSGRHLEFALKSPQLTGQCAVTTRKVRA